VKILIVGGGPAGLYAGLLMKKSDPTRRIEIVERNPRGATYGWGVVFSDRTLNAFREADTPTYQAITDSFVTWDAIDIHFKDQTLRCGGNAFAGMARKRLLDILTDRCLELGIPITFEKDIRDFAEFARYDLVIAADGVNSLIRAAHVETFKPSLEPGKCKYIWFGTQRSFDSFTFSIRPNEHGLFQAHTYPFDGQTSTFIVECDEATWRCAGLDQAGEAESIAYCERLFADDLRGHRLMSNKSQWINFVIVKNRVWHHRNLILLGDSAHTAHFSIGSGTKLAMEDAIALSHAFDEHQTVEDALVNYTLDRKPRVEALQAAARESQDYFETLKRFIHLEAPQFAFHLLTRSGRLNYDNLRIRDIVFVDRVERWFHDSHTLSGKASAPTILAPPPLFIPLRLKGLTLPNRAALIAPSSDACIDGLPDAGLKDALLRRAEGGAALVITPQVAISADARFTPGDPGLYAAKHRTAWARLARQIHADTPAKLAIQLSHAGRRGASMPRRMGLDRPLAEGGWPLISASPSPYTPVSQTPKAMHEAAMEAVCADFARTAADAAQAGFDLLILDAAHGGLLASFLSPLTNRRKDSYGGALKNRLRFPLRVLDAVRDAWPAERPLAVAINASDWTRGGIPLEDVPAIAAAFKERGCDLIWPLAGQTVLDETPEYGPEFLAAYSERIRHEAHIATLVSGGLTTTNQANSILAGGRADLVILDPYHVRD
jgi:anthraniloyl-CoA monooxygenase